MSTTVALGCGFVLFAGFTGVLGALVLVMRRRLHDGHARHRRLVEANQKLTATGAALRTELEGARADLQEEKRGSAQLAAELEASIRWNEELKAAQDEVRELIDGRPRPRRNQRGDHDRERNAWIYRMRAAMAAESHVPPHEQDGDGR